MDNIVLKDDVEYVIQTPPSPEDFEENVTPVDGNVTTLDQATDGDTI